MKRRSVLMVVSLLFAGTAWAQTPVATSASAPSRVAVIDFNRAVTENADGKKAQAAFMAEISGKQTEFTKIQKDIETIQSDLQSKAAALSDQAKATMAKQIDDKQILLTRMNEDAQKEVPDLQQRMFGPVADRTQKIIKSYSDEVGLAAVFDISSQANPIIYFPDVADITTEVIRRIDADIAKSPTPASPAARPPAAATTPAPK